MKIAKLMYLLKNANGRHENGKGDLSAKKLHKQCVLRKYRIHQLCDVLTEAQRNCFAIVGADFESQETWALADSRRQKSSRTTELLSSVC